uniref:Glycopeptide resistance-associated protein R n=2 Tax=Pectobacterium carotovorum TaxID=554 RepID=A0A0N9NRW2_PECCA|nr:Glycopeptide resistance-associated protein R [Pectobacterium carotovorum]
MTKKATPKKPPGLLNIGQDRLPGWGKSSPLLLGKVNQVSLILPRNIIKTCYTEKNQDYSITLQKIFISEKYNNVCSFVQRGVSMKYLINEKIVFCTENKTLNNGIDNIELNLTCTRLLEILVTKKNVSREYILDNVWEAYGLTPSDNNLNKNISVLRKTFVILGVDSSLIETIPKEGFLFNANVTSNNETSKEKNHKKL